MKHYILTIKLIIVKSKLLPFSAIGKSSISLCLFCLFSLFSFGQSEAHDFITYDTVVHIQPYPSSPFNHTDWNVRITRPANMFTANHPDTASRPMILTMPGAGEMGVTDTANLAKNGPHYWLQHGWDGSVVLANGTHYPIIITVACTSTPAPNADHFVPLLQYILDHYHIKRNAVHLGGLSQGAFTITSSIAFEATAGAETGMKLMSSITALEGFTVDLGTMPAAAWSRGLAAYGVWAKKYHGHFFGLEGTADYRNVAPGEKAMNDSVPGSAYFAYENIGGGTHCCWDTMYDPKRNNWQSFSPYGPNVATGADTNSRGTYVKGSSIFQWMLRQGDTSLVGGSTPPPPPSPTAINQVVVAEYRTWYIRNDSTIYGYNNGSAYPVQFPIGGRKAVKGAGGFNVFRIIDDSGYVWSSRTDFSTTTDRQNTDTAGNPYNGNIFVDAYASTVVNIRSDSSVWYWGADAYNLFYTGGSLGPIYGGTMMRPTQLSPAGMKFRKVLLGGNKIVGLTTTGSVYVWLPGGSRTPTLMTIPRPAVDIFVSHVDIAGCIIPDAGENSGLGYPYIWGTRTSMYGGSTAFTQPTSVKTLWNMTVPIREISVNWNAIHYIDSIGRLFGGGFNSMGEVGNGQEFVNKFTYPGFPGYSWTFADGENPSGIPSQIGTGTTWKHLYSNNWFAFYKYAKDANDSIYSWGRNKALVLGNGFINLQEASSPDAMDVLAPTMVHPLSARYQAYNFTAPVLSAGSDQSVTATSTTLTATGHAAAVVHSGALFNGIDSVGYHWVGFQWTKLSGPACTITSPTAQTTTVTGMTNGSYKFQVIATDNNTGTISDTVNVTVDTTYIPPTVTAGPDKSVSLPTDSVVLNGSATGHGTTIHAINWVKVSGPNSPTITTTSAGQVATVHGLIQGIYVFSITATDNHGLSASDSVTVTVDTAYIPPTVTAGPDKTVSLPVDSVVLNGNATGHGTTIHAISWVKVSGPNSPTITTTDAGQTATVHGLVQGTYVFSITATDNHGLSASDSVTVTALSGGAGYSNGAIEATSSRINASSPMAEQFLLYPTISREGGTATIALTSDAAGPVQIRVFDMHGKVLFTIQSSKNGVYFNKTLSVGSLPAGIYAVQVLVGNNKLYTAKFIRQ